jgi:hypothetical protein
MNNFFKIFPIVFLLTLSIVANAQCNYKPGKIITNTNDTIVGFISDGGGKKNSKYCIYRPDKNSQPKKYYPKDIKSYLFTGDKYYSSEVIPIKKESTPLFCDMLLEGKISLFYPRTGKDLPYYLKLENGSLVELSDKTIVFDKDVPGENPIHYEKYMYQDTLYILFKDAGITKKQIADVEYNDKSLQKITKAYLDSTCKEKSCITYERNPNISKPSYGIFTGIQYSGLILLNSQLEYDIVPEKDLSVPIGVLYNHPLSLLSDRLSVQIEFMLSRYSYNVYFPYVPADSANQKMTSNVFSIPLFFKYGIKMKKFTPTLGFGKEIGLVFNSKLPYTRVDPNPDPNQESIFTITNYQLHWQQKGGWFFDLGLTYQIHPKYALFSSIRLQTQRNLIIEDGNAKNYTYNKSKKENWGKEYRTNMASIRLGVIF